MSLFWAAIFLTGAGLEILTGAQAWPAVLSGSLNDPDSYMRLERLLQSIAQGYLVNVVARDDSGAGVMVEWSRLLDALIWALAAPLAPILGWRHAVYAAGVALGPLGAGTLGLCLAFAAEPFAARKFLWLVPPAAVLLPGLATFELPGVVHYHVLLLALIAATAGFLARAWEGDTGQGFLAGACGGLAIWLTPETMPFILMIFAALLIRWWWRDVGGAVLACAAGFFDVIGFGFAIDPPSGGYGVPEVDRLSLVYVCLGLLVLLGAGVVVRARRLAGWRRRLVGFGAMAGLILLWVALFPKVAEGPYGLMSAAEQKRFFGVMLELQPVRDPVDMLAFLAPGLLAVVYAAGRAWLSTTAPARAVWLHVTICGLVALVLARKFILFVEFPAGLAAGLLPVALSDCSRRLAARPQLAMLARVAVVGAVFLLPRAPALASIWHQPKPVAAGPAAPSCGLRHIDGFLAPYAGRIVLADIADTPELLYRTGILTVGSLYQHGVPAYLRAQDAWNSRPASALPAAMAATGARYVLFCPGPALRPAPRPGPATAGKPAATLRAALQAGQPPRWLVLVAADPASAHKLYAVRPVPAD